MKNQEKDLEEIKQSINMNEFYVHLMNIRQNLSSVDRGLDKIKSDIYYLKEYHQNRQFYNNLLMPNRIDDLLPQNEFNIYSFALYPKSYQPSACGTVVNGMHKDVNFSDGSSYQGLEVFSGRDFNQLIRAVIHPAAKPLEHLIVCFKLPQLPAKYQYKHQWNNNFFKKINLVNTGIVSDTHTSLVLSMNEMNDQSDQGKLMKQFYSIIDNTMYFIIRLDSLMKLQSYLMLSLEIGSIFDLIEQSIDSTDTETINKLHLMHIYIDAKYGETNPSLTAT